jgi:hypothetical protein
VLLLLLLSLSLSLFKATFTQTHILADNFWRAVRVGNYLVAGELVKSLVVRGGFGFNFLHYQALSLSDGKPFDTFRRISVTKKPYNNLNITPIHCACINPDPSYLQRMCIH